MVKVSRRTGAVVMAVGPLKTAFRDLAFRTVSLIPAVKRYLGSMRFITPPDCRDGLALKAGQDVDRRVAAWVGFALSQPIVTDPDGWAERLDEHLGEGWALLTLKAENASITTFDPYWASLGARFLRLGGTPDRPTAEDGGPFLLDAGRVLALPDLAKPHIVVVRPDRYVAAVFTDQSEQSVINKLRSYVDPLCGSDESRRKECPVCRK
jgi:3-(3-hydroxy-phenyl)propionate hydroxylase